MQERKHYVYTHARGTDGVVFYVGLGHGKRAHSKKSRNRYWHHVEQKHGRVVAIVERGLTLEEACSLEKDLIAKYGRSTEGGSLVNMTAGGEGAIDPSPETRERIAAANRGKWAGDANPSKNPEVIAKRTGDSHWTKSQPECVARGEKSGRKTHPESYAHLAGVKRDIKAAKGDNHPRRINPEKWAGAIGENHPRRKNPELWVNAIGDGHWTKKPGASEKLSGGKNGYARAVRCVETGQVFESASMAAKHLGIRQFLNLATGIRNNAPRYGFHWEYVDAKVEP